MRAYTISIITFSIGHSRQWGCFFCILKRCIDFMMVSELSDKNAKNKYGKENPNKCYRHKDKTLDPRLAGWQIIVCRVVKTGYFICLRTKLSRFTMTERLNKKPSNKITILISIHFRFLSSFIVSQFSNTILGTLGPTCMTQQKPIKD